MIITFINFYMLFSENYVLNYNYFWTVRTFVEFNLFIFIFSASCKLKLCFEIWINRTKPACVYIYICDLKAEPYKRNPQGIPRHSDNNVNLQSPSRHHPPFRHLNHHRSLQNSSTAAASAATSITRSATTAKTHHSSSSSSFPSSPPLHSPISPSSISKLHHCFYSWY